MSIVYLLNRNNNIYWYFIICLSYERCSSLQWWWWLMRVFSLDWSNLSGCQSYAYIMHKYHKYYKQLQMHTCINIKVCALSCSLVREGTRNLLALFFLFHFLHGNKIFLNHFKIIHFFKCTTKKITTKISST